VIILQMMQLSFVSFKTINHIHATILGRQKAQLVLLRIPLLLHQRIPIEIFTIKLE